MPEVTIKVGEEIEVEGEMAEFIFKVPVMVKEDRGQRGQYGIPLEPDEAYAEIYGTIEVQDGDEVIEVEEFHSRYENADEAISEVVNNKQRLYDRAKSKLQRRDTVPEIVDQY